MSEVLFDVANDMLFIEDMNSDYPISKTAIHDKLNSAIFNKLQFVSCNSIKVYECTFSHLKDKCKPIISLQISSIEESILHKIQSALFDLIQINSSCLINLTITVHSWRSSTFNHHQLFESLSKCNCIQSFMYNGFHFDSRIKLDLLSTFLSSKCLRKMDLSLLALNGKQTHELSTILFSSSYSISEFTFGGNDTWTIAGIQIMCKYIHNNHNLHELAIQLRKSSFLSASNIETVKAFISAINRHKSLQTLELRNITSETIEILGVVCDRDKQNKISFPITEFSIVHVNCRHYRNMVLSLGMMINKVLWLEILRLRSGFECDVKDALDLSEIFATCPHLHYISVWCRRLCMSQSQIYGCVNKMFTALKEVNKRNKIEIKNGYLQAIQHNFMIVNDGNISSVDAILSMEILSYADLCLANDIGILSVSGTFLRQLDVRDRKKVNDYMLGNCDKLKERSQGNLDEGYIEWRTDLSTINARIEKKLQEMTD